MARTTSDCRAFLVSEIQGCPSLFNDIWDDEDRPDIAVALDPRNWVRRYKCRPGMGPYDGEYPDHIVWERGFDCKGTDGALAFIVLEDKDGNLSLGDDIGD